jgi:hypothetical protein
MAIGAVLGVTTATARAQSAPDVGQQGPDAVKTQADLNHSRYQIAQMERALEGAVEHGATITRDRLQAVVPPAQMLISDNARVRGFRLEGYGVFFDVEVPSLQGTLPWSFRTLDQNDLGLESALKALKAHVEKNGDIDLQQALKRVELQVAPMPALASSMAASVAGARNATGSAASAQDRPAGQRLDSILTDPDEAYRQEVKQALMEAMLDYSGPLSIGPEEWLTIAARGYEERPRLAPADSNVRTVVIRARGADLTAFRAAQLSKEEALKRIEVRVF